MKNHIKAFILSAVIVLAGGILSKYIDLNLSVEMIEQAKAISYLVTLGGVVTAFSWYKRTAIPVEQGDESVPAENVEKQNRVLIYMTIINFVNACVLSLSPVEPIQLMSGISLIVVIISPVVFRTMQEKDAVAPKEEDNNEEQSTH